LLETDNPSKAIECYLEAVEIYETEEKDHFSIDTFKALIGLLVKNERWEEAIKLMDRQSMVFEKIKQPHNVCKVCLSAILIHLHQDDYIAADRAYNNFVS
jgi:pentatricopeptide repeat protein